MPIRVALPSLHLRQASGNPPFQFLRQETSFARAIEAGEDYP